MTGQVGVRLAEIRERLAKAKFDGRLDPANRGRWDDYCAFIAAAPADLAATSDALLAVLALAEKWQGWGDRDPDSPVAAVFAGELRRAVASHLDPGATT